MKGKDLIKFITDNKLEEVAYVYKDEYECIEFTVTLTDVQYLEYTYYLNDGLTCITLVEKIIDAEEKGLVIDEDFVEVSSEFALKFRGLAE